MLEYRAWPLTLAYGDRSLNESYEIFRTLDKSLLTTLLGMIVVLASLYLEKIKSPSV